MTDRLGRLQQLIDMERRLAEIRRRVGPCAVARNDEPFRVNDAQIARSLLELIEIVEQLVEQARTLR